MFHAFLVVALVVLSVASGKVKIGVVKVVNGAKLTELYKNYGKFFVVPSKKTPRSCSSEEWTALLC
jgi:hypothetical protein